MRKLEKRAHLGLKTLFCTNSSTLLKTLRSGVPRAKMTKHADLGLKMLFCTNSALC